MKKVYLNEYNCPTYNTIYFPFSSGLLRAYAETIPEIANNYEFMPFLFVRETIDKIMEKYDNPSVVGFSNSVWNYQINLAVAKALKEKFPKCITVFGGPHVVKESKDFFTKHPFIDIVIFGEGEKTFAKLLIDLLNTDIQTHQVLLNTEEATKDLDIFPSPYVSGMFDYMLKKYPELEFKSIVETNRNCPFSCSFCFWGDYSSVKKVTNHSLEFVRAEAEWIAEKQIPYVFCADANFGMFSRDIEIAQAYADIKQKNNYPEKFRVCYGKNKMDNVFATASILSHADLAKTVTLAMQSDDKNVLKQINRANIKKEVYDNLQKKYTAAGIPTYTEIILGLPEESKETFVNGLESILRSSLDNQVFVYHCQILPNTEMADLDYQKKFDIKTAKNPLAEVHGSRRPDEIITEYEDLIIQTGTMPVEDWIQCSKLAWVIQLLHGLKLGFYIVRWMYQNYEMKYTDFYEYIVDNLEYKTADDFNKIASGIPKGIQRCQYRPEYGEIYWEPEEVAFLDIIYDKENFYVAFHDVIKQYLQDRNLEYNDKILELIDYQKGIVPTPEDFDNSQDLAKEVILYGRKSNKLVKSDPMIMPYS